MSKGAGKAGDAVWLVAAIQPGVFPRVPGDLPKDYPEQSPPGNAWTIDNYRERRCYRHFGRPAEWAEEVQWDYDPEGLMVVERRRLVQSARWPVRSMLR